MLQHLLSCPYVCAVVSALSETFLTPKMAKDDPGVLSEYLVSYDALDGTSNLHAGVNTGTIFAIYKRRSPTGSEVLQSDALQVCISHFCMCA